MKKILPLTASLFAASALAGGAGLPAGGSPAQANAQASPAFRTIACPAEIKASQCGYVKVPLDHAQPQGPQIELFVAVQKAAAPAAQRAADPLFYLEGGPGGPSSVSAGPLGEVFPNRDVVGIDQRGIGRSLPSLACASLNTLMSRTDVKTADILPLFQKGIEDCAKELRSKGLALEQFNTTQAAQDVDMVRRALGYGKINLYGASYGTRLAQEVMRASPSALRSVVLDSVIPTSVDRVARTPLALQEGLQRVFAACQTDKDCNARYPNLEQTYRDTLKKLEAQPLKVNMGGQSELDGTMLQGLVFNSMYFQPGLQEIPSLIVAARDGKAGVIEKSFAAKMVMGLKDTLTWPAFFTNECMGEVAYSTPAALEKGLQAAPEFASTLRLSPSISSPSVFGICKTLGLTTPASRENDPLKSDVPTLLLAGEFDPVTPVNWLKEAASGLSRGQSLVISGAAHGSGLTSQCGYQSVMGFLADPTKKVAAAYATQGKLTFK